MYNFFSKAHIDFFLDLHQYLSYYLIPAVSRVSLAVSSSNLWAGCFLRQNKKSVHNKLYVGHRFQFIWYEPYKSTLIHETRSLWNAVQFATYNPTFGFNNREKDFTLDTLVCYLELTTISVCVHSTYYVYVYYFSIFFCVLVEFDSLIRSGIFLFWYRK